MDVDGFDTLARQLVRAGSRRQVLTGLAAGIAANVAARHAAAARQGDVAASRKRNDGKVAICHRKHTKRVLPAALNVHLDHGDKLGPCGKRRRKRPLMGDDNSTWRGFSLLLINPLTSNAPIRVVCGDPRYGISNVCHEMVSYELQPGESRLFMTSSHNAYCWVQDRYWVVLGNPLVGKPDVSVAAGGSGPDSYACYDYGWPYVFLINRAFAEDENVKATDPTSDPANTFWIWRRGDEPDYKSFWVIFPSNW